MTRLATLECHVVEAGDVVTLVPVGRPHAAFVVPLPPADAYEVARHVYRVVTVMIAVEEGA